MNTETLLIEIGTEELPPTAVKNLGETFASIVSRQLDDAGFAFDSSHAYFTPRRLAVMLNNLSNTQPNQTIERKGPALQAAFDEDGNPTKAAIGFAKSCGIEIEHLERQETDKGSWLYFKSDLPGKTIQEVIPEIVNRALKELPIPRPMRWGNSDIEFVRPIHWVVMMYGEQTISREVKGVISANKTYGHRFHAPGEIILKHADQYTQALLSANVIVDFYARKSKITQLIETSARERNAKLNYEDSLLDEVTNLVEWPFVVIGEFSTDFLDIPQEVLVATMQEAQRYFPLFSEEDDSLLPYFIVIANIESTNPATIQLGNERVIKPRFEDAGFFWKRDKQRSLASRQEDLEGILFEKQLGSMLDKTKRISFLAESLADVSSSDKNLTVRSAQLCKCDLLTEMVNEFPKLQGVMGRYYAQNDGEPTEVASAIEEHYQPLQSGGVLPTTNIGKIVAVCDRIDTLVGIFATGKKPTGMKDPYALRRAALGVIRISIEGNLDFDLHKLLLQSAQSLSEKLDAGNAADEVLDFIYERLRGYCLDKGFNIDTFEAVRNVCPRTLVDFQDRINAVQKFRRLPEAGSLAAANKRIRNILKKENIETTAVKNDLFVEQAECELFYKLEEIENIVSNNFTVREYSESLSNLAELKPVIDQFFDQVMVMDNDSAIRTNRVALVAQVDRLLSKVADISSLQI